MILTNQKLNHSKSAFFSKKNHTNVDWIKEKSTPFSKDKEKPLSKEALDFDLFFKKFTNLLMIDGKKRKACNILLKMLTILKKRLKKDYEKKNHLIEKPNLKNILVNFTLFSLIFKALDNVTPNLEVRKVRVAGSTYIVPAVLSKKKQETLALKWIIESAKKRQKITKFNFSTCLADEILDASRKLGQARQKRDELHRLAQMNRAYVRYRWW